MDSGTAKCAACGRECAAHLTHCTHCAASLSGAAGALPDRTVLEALEDNDPPAIGRYRLKGRLGAGGMGVVYLAEAPDGTRYALKALAGSHRMGTELRARLAREARSLAAVDSPHVVHVVDVDTGAEVPYLVMTYAEGVGLDKAVPTGGLGAPAVLQYGTQLAGAVEHVHARGILHRDLKPQNVILGPSGATLVDFGIASLDDEGTTALTRQGTFLGSLAWMPPELIQGGSADEASDVFALGLVLGYMALGRHPFGAGRPEAVMYRIMHEQPDLTGCDPGLAPIIEAALAKDPADRASAQQTHFSLQAQLEVHTQHELLARQAEESQHAQRARQEEQARQELRELQLRQEAQMRMELQALQARLEEQARQELAEWQARQDQQEQAQPSARQQAARSMPEVEQSAATDSTDHPVGRGFNRFTRLMAMWGVVAAAATVITGLHTIPEPDDLVDTFSPFGIGWPDLALATGWIALAAALAIGAVSLIRLLRYRASGAPALVYWIGLAAGVAAFASEIAFNLADGETLVAALQWTFLPATLDPTLYGAIWQLTVIALLAWIGMCVTGLVRSRRAAAIASSRHAAPESGEGLFPAAAAHQRPQGQSAPATPGPTGLDLSPRGSSAFL